MNNVHRMSTAGSKPTDTDCLNKLKLLPQYLHTMTRK